jgi:hypothetical protein
MISGWIIEICMLELAANLPFLAGVLVLQQG